MKVGDKVMSEPGPDWEHGVVTRILVAGEIDAKVQVMWDSGENTPAYCSELEPWDGEDHYEDGSWEPDED